MKAAKEQQRRRGAEAQRSRHCLGAFSPLRLRALFTSLTLFLCCATASAVTGTDPADALGLQAPSEAVEAPAFSLTDLTGKKVQLKALQGKLVLLNFFATWCGPCREEMPGMERLFRSYQDKGLVVVGINLQESVKAVRPFVDQLNLSFPIVMDPEGTVTREYGVRALPVTFLIGRDRNIRWRAIGGRDWESGEFHQYFEKLFQEKK